MNSVPQTAATTFAFSSVCFFFYGIYIIYFTHLQHMTEVGEDLPGLSLQSPLHQLSGMLGPIAHLARQEQCRPHLHKEI